VYNVSYFGLCRKKFSVSNFASDCAKYKCTVVQYIGELCRYLTSSAPNPAVEDSLNIQYAIGNGMRREVWEPFQKRFGVKRVVELYSATEGNIALFNSTNKVGPLGMIPRVLDPLYPVT
jgi:hypothetical protein